MYDLPPRTILSEPLQVSVPQGGFFRRLSPLYFRDRYAGGKKRKPTDGDWLPVVIWYGAPCDPETGELLDRSWRWQCLVSGQYADPYDQWTWSCANPLDAIEYQELLEATAGLPTLADLELMANEDDNGRYVYSGPDRDQSRYPESW